jgi:hypothetical protein
MNRLFVCVLMGLAATSPAAVAVAVADAADAPRYVRDWQVERPVTSGVLRGLTLGLFPGPAFGHGTRAASPSDPFGMSALVHGEVQRLSARSHHLGTATGLAFWAFSAAGVVHRRRRLRQAAALEIARVA